MLTNEYDTDPSTERNKWENWDWKKKAMQEIFKMKPSHSLGMLLVCNVHIWCLIIICFWVIVYGHVDDCGIFSIVLLKI